ncbi:MAG: hypothetical protein ACLFSM_08685 [Thermoplasmata archaeon]
MEDSELTPCRHEVDKAGGKERLKIQCERCDQTFDPVECLPGVLLAMDGMYGVGFIVISDYTEERLGDNQIDILKQMKDIMEDIENFSTRVTPGEDCQDCGLFPSSLYTGLRKRFISNPGVLYEELPKLKEKIETPEGCSACKDDLRHELDILAEKALDLRADILTDGFGIIG